MELFDSHAHYNDEKFNRDRQEILQNIYNFGITKLVNAGYSLKSSKQAVEMAEEYKFIYSTCGISPNDLNNNYLENIKKIKKLVKEKRVKGKIVAIGEIGLDYYWNKENKDMQKDCFIKQIELANELELPIVIHTRDAYLDTIQILKENECKKRGVFHCCPLNMELVKDAILLGFYISFAGPITFKNVKNADEIVKIVPNDKMLIETDSPYLSPEPFRGNRNDSRNIKYMAEKIAKVKGIPTEEIAKITYENAERIFNIL